MLYCLNTSLFYKLVTTKTSIKNSHCFSRLNLKGKLFSFAFFNRLHPTLCYQIRTKDVFPRCILQTSSGLPSMLFKLFTARPSFCASIPYSLDPIFIQTFPHTHRHNNIRISDKKIIDLLKWQDSSLIMRHNSEGLQNYFFTKLKQEYIK